MRCTDRAHSLLRDARGSATTEGVIIAPVFILLFAIGIWAYTRYHAGLENVDAVRDGLWREALNGCDEGPRDAELLHEARFYEARSRPRVPALAHYYDEVRAESLSSSDVRRVARPAPLGGGDMELRYRASTSCNPIPVDFGSDLPYAIQLTFCRAVPYCDDHCECDAPPD